MLHNGIDLQAISRAVNLPMGYPVSIDYIHERGEEYRTVEWRYNYGRNRIYILLAKDDLCGWMLNRILEHVIYVDN